MTQVKLIKEGNRLVYSRVFEEYHLKLYQYIYKYTQSAWYAEETVQLTFVKLWDKREQLSEDHDISTQLFRIAKSILIDLLRKESLRHTLELSDTFISASPVEESLVYKDQLQNVLAAIEELPTQSRQVFKLSRLGDLSHKEISQQLSISPKTIEGHISRALKSLRKGLISLF
jgi:RNA polymerase sigma-70 factor (ECF subfamily)